MAFPQVQGVSTTHSTTSSTQHTVNLPSGIAAGDHLVCILVWGGLRINSAGMVDWSTIANATPSNQQNTFILNKIASGSEGTSTVIHTNGGPAHLAAYTYRIDDATTNAIEAALSSGNSSTTDPPSLSPAWGAKDTLWIAATTVKISTGMSGFPSGYSNTDETSTTAPSTGVRVGTARRELNAASEDPGTFTHGHSAGRWIGVTIAVEPTDGAGPAAVFGGYPWLTQMGYGT